MKQARRFLYAMLSAILIAVPALAEAQFQMPDAASTGLPTGSIFSIISRAMNWLLAIFGFIAIIAFVISGIQYLTAAGDESQADVAKRNMQLSIIGVMVGLAGYVIINAINCMLGAYTISLPGVSISLFSC